MDLAALKLNDNKTGLERRVRTDTSVLSSKAKPKLAKNVKIYILNLELFISRIIKR